MVTASSGGACYQHEAAGPAAATTQCLTLDGFGRPGASFAAAAAAALAASSVVAVANWGDAGSVAIPPCAAVGDGVGMASVAGKRDESGGHYTVACDAAVEAVAFAADCKGTGERR